MSKLGHLKVAGIYSYILLTRDSGDLWEGELLQSLLLIDHHKHTGQIRFDKNCLKIRALDGICYGLLMFDFD
jgi:hypothetical protein